MRGLRGGVWRPATAVQGGDGFEFVDRVNGCRTALHQVSDRRIDRLLLCDARSTVEGCRDDANLEVAGAGTPYRDICLGQGSGDRRREFVHEVVGLGRRAEDFERHAGSLDVKRHEVGEDARRFLELRRGLLVGFVVFLRFLGRDFFLFLQHFV